MNIKIFHFNPIMENTMVLSDDNGDAVIVDPGNCCLHEDELLRDYIVQHNLLVKYILNTHPHVDHIAGNQWSVDEYRVPLCMHTDALPVYKQAFAYAAAFGIEVKSFPEPDKLLEEGDIIHYGTQQLKVIATPGHCAGSVTFYDPENKFVICGDLLFEGSIGRADLPTGDEELLIRMVKEKLLPLGDDITVYPGHGGPTTLGNERKFNPFLQ